MAFPGFRTDHAERTAREVHAVQEDVLGSRGEFGMVLARECAKELGNNCEAFDTAFVCTSDGLSGLRLFLLCAGDIIHASDEKRPGPTVRWCSTK